MGKHGPKFGQYLLASKAIEHPTIKDIYWAAAIWEGEGSVSQSGQVSVTQKRKWILNRFKKLFGGHISPIEGVGVYKTHKCYRWQISGARARGFLLTIYTILSPHRKKQVKWSFTVKRNREKEYANRRLGS